MITKTAEKELAIKLRKQGKTYSEILSQVNVAKSTLSIWLGDVGLSKKQKQNITQKRIDAQRRGADARHRDRIERSSAIFNAAKSDIKKISKRELFLIGVILYWAEGSKEKDHKPGSGVQFCNMDARMVQVFLKWLFEVCKVQKNMIVCELAIHETHRHRVPEIKAYWGKVTDLGVDHFRSVYFKKHKPIATKRKNVGTKYFGVIKITVRQSSQLLRKISGWTEGVFQQTMS